MSGPIPADSRHLPECGCRPPLASLSAPFRYAGLSGHAEHAWLSSWPESGCNGNTLYLNGQERRETFDLGLQGDREAAAAWRERVVRGARRYRTEQQYRTGRPTKSPAEAGLDVNNA